MSGVRSLRRRIVGGAIAWSVGLLIVASAILAAVIDHHRAAAGIVHAALAHTTVVVLLALGLLLAGFWFVRGGLSSFSRLRERLADVHRGEAARVSGVYPAEVQPLVDDLNTLLEHRDQALVRAQARAGDLAHGLKTPLAILTHEVQQLRAHGRVDLAASLEEQIVRMRRQIDYQLAHARAAAAGAVGRSTASTGVAAVTATLVRTVSRLHAERHLSIDVHVDEGHRVRCQREDLEEMVGNLLDNACKWARTRVRLTATEDESGCTLLVEDDGAGLEPEDAEAALQRGRRLDEAVPGSGLGLAITRDLVELYGGTLDVGRSSLGGVAARLRLPAGPR